MVDDEPWFAPQLKTARVIPREPEPLWEVRCTDHHTGLPLLRHHGEWGVDAQLTFVASAGDPDYQTFWRSGANADDACSADDACQG